MSRLPGTPNGVSARAANAATPDGASYTGCSRDGISQGRLRPTRTASTVRTRSAAPPGRLMPLAPAPAGARGPARAAAGRMASALMLIAANPPMHAGSSARLSRPAPRHETTSCASTDLSAQGRPA